MILLLWKETSNVRRIQKEKISLPTVVSCKVITGSRRGDYMQSYAAAAYEVDDTAGG